MQIDNFISKEVQQLFQEDIVSVLDAIINCMDCAVIMTRKDHDGFVVWNKKAREFLGKSQAKLPPEEWSDYYGVFDHPGSSPIPVENLPLVRALKGEMVVDQEIFVQNEVQHGTWLNCTAQPLKNGNEIIGAVLVMIDLTKEKELIFEQKKLLSTIDKIRVSQKQLQRIIP